MMMRLPTGPQPLTRTLMQQRLRWQRTHPKGRGKSRWMLRWRQLQWKMAMPCLLRSAWKDPEEFCQSLSLRMF